MKRIIFIGQAMPRYKSHPHDWPSLNRWLYSIGLSDELLVKWTLYSALVDYFPGSKKGSHLVPTTEEIDAERERLRGTLMAFKPDIVVPIGKLSIAHCIGEKVDSLRDYIGKSYKGVPYGLYLTELPIIPLPHPSGASTWRYQAGNMERLTKALELLRGEIV